MTSKIQETCRGAGASMFVCLSASCDKPIQLNNSAFLYDSQPAPIGRAIRLRILGLVHLYGMHCISLTVRVLEVGTSVYIVDNVRIATRNGRAFIKSQRSTRY